jgi:hypothetical protein
MVGSFIIQSSGILFQTEIPTLFFAYSLLFITEIITKQSPAVFIVMAENTQIFPVRTIRGIIPVIAIFMVYGQEMTVCV